MGTHVIWTLSDEGEWETDGELLSERKALVEVASLRQFGLKGLALPLGKEPEKLHPADRAIVVRYVRGVA